MGTKAEGALGGRLFSNQVSGSCTHSANRGSPQRSQRDQARRLGPSTSLSATATPSTSAWITCNGIKKADLELLKPFDSWRVTAGRLAKRQHFSVAARVTGRAWVSFLPCTGKSHTTAGLYRQLTSVSKVVFHRGPSQVTVVITKCRACADTPLQAVPVKFRMYERI